MIRNVVRFPSPLLNKRSLPIEVIDDEIKMLAKDMIDTMRAENGIGISGVQVGVLKRIMVVSVKKSSSDRHFCPEVMINPKILSRDGDQIMTEGCLSFPGLSISVNRNDCIEIEYQSLEGEMKKALLYGVESVCFQHELDHLDGIVFINRSQKVL